MAGKGNAATIADSPRRFGARALRGLAVAAVAVVVFVLTYRPVTDPDTWFHLEVGQWILEHRLFPHTDPFSFTAGDNRYVPSGWLTSVIMAKLDQLYPESSLGPILMVTLTIGLASGVVLWRGLRCGTFLVTSLLLMSGLVMAVVRFSPRPDVWTIACLTITLAILSSTFSRSRTSPSLSEIPALWKLWLLVPLVILWANLHAGVLVALPFLGSYLAYCLLRWKRERNRAWAMAAVPVALACVAWLANPYGPGLLYLATRINSIPDVHWVMEWMPFFSERFSLAWPVYASGLVIAAAIIWVCATRWSAIHPLEIIWLMLLVAFALWQRRQVSLLALGVPLILARHLAPLESWLLQDRWKSLVLLPSTAALIVFLQVSGANGNGGGKPGFGRNCTVLPCITADFLAANPPPQPIFNSYNMGGYLLHVLSPVTKVFIDGRLDVYPGQVWLDMLAVEENRLSIDDLVSKYGLQSFVVETRDAFGDPMHLASRLAARNDFALVHFDDVAAVFVRRSAGTNPWLANAAFTEISPWNLKATAERVRRNIDAPKVVNQMTRLMQLRGQSAAAGATAAFVAWAAGDQQTYEAEMAAARQLDPTHPLLLLVTLQMQAGLPATP